MKSVILLVDDQDTIRFFLEKTLTQEGYETITAKLGAEAVEKARKVMPDQLLMVIRKGLESGRLNREVLQLKRQMDLDVGFDFIMGDSPRMERVYEVVRQVAKSDTTSVLIEGESGVGKEMIARLIHRFSARAEKPFLDINCASLPEQLLESELFGYEKGAFTDAKTQKQGLLEIANRGTLFLDEIGEMSLTIQVKLLRVMERMVFRRVGGTSDIHVSVRIISATNRDLEKELEEKRFRPDLYYRLKVVPMYIPPLRERKEDLLKFVHYYLSIFTSKFNKHFDTVSDEATEVMLAYMWPGNIRELKNVIERIVLLENGPVIRPDHLPFSATRMEERTLGRKIDNMLSQDLPADGIDFDTVVSELEKELIVKASNQTGWNQSRTARLLNLKRDKLRYRMKNFNLDNENEVPTK
jgi:DNA-binding NtrC family response regulator